MATRKPAQSLNDLVNGNSKKETDQVIDETPDETPDNDNRTSEVMPQETNDLEESGTEVVEHGENVDQQVDINNNDDGLGNPNGVTFGDKSSNVIDKTPADLAAESPAESQKRFGINDEVPDDVHNNPNIQVRKDDGVQQIASGTHLHPDVARDHYNRSVGHQPENSAVTRTVTEYAYATEAEHDDKGLRRSDVDDRDVKRNNEDDI
jgi:hypothetical protein